VVIGLLNLDIGGQHMRKTILWLLLVIGILWIFPLVSIYAAQEATMNDRLCLDSERLVFSFQTEDTGKILSICVANNYEYIVYRFGTADNIELEFPETREGSWDKFTFHCYHRGGGATNAGLDENHLSFVNGDYEFLIRDDFVASSGPHQNDPHQVVDILITNKVTGERFLIKGIVDSRLGNLADFRESWGGWESYSGDRLRNALMKNQLK